MTHTKHIPIETSNPPATMHRLLGRWLAQIDAGTASTKNNFNVATAEASEARRAKKVALHQELAAQRPQLLEQRQQLSEQRKQLKATLDEATAKLGASSETVIELKRSFQRLIESEVELLDLVRQSEEAPPY